MEHSKRLATRLRDVVLSGFWVAGTNCKKLLSDVTWKQATQNVKSLNTIALLTFHINYYIAGVLNVFEGGNLEIRDAYSFDAPQILSERDWVNLCNDLWTNTERLANCIEQTPDEQWHKTFVDEKYGSYQRNIEGIIEHCYYHFGQISLIKKMIIQTETDG